MALKLEDETEPQGGAMGSGSGAEMTGVNDMQSNELADVLLTNLPWFTTDTEVERAVHDAAHVSARSVEMLDDFEGCRPLGAALLSLPSAEVANSCKGALNGYELHGRRISATDGSCMFLLHSFLALWWLFSLSLYLLRMTFRFSLLQAMLLWLLQMAAVLWF